MYQGSEHDTACRRHSYYDEVWRSNKKNTVKVLSIHDPLPSRISRSSHCNRAHKRKDDVIDVNDLSLFLVLRY